VCELITVRFEGVVDSEVVFCVGAMMESSACAGSKEHHKYNPRHKHKCKCKQRHA
jgi:hypothetical protein